MMLTKPEKLSEHVYIIDRVHWDRVYDNQYKYTYAVHLYNSKWIWIRDGQTSLQLHDEAYETLEECLTIYNLIYYGNKKEESKIHG